MMDSMSLGGLLMADTAHPGAIPTNWIIGALVLPALAWSISVLWLLKDIKRTNDVLIEMHRAADDHGFGTVALSKTMGKLCHHSREQAYYLKHLASQSPGGAPPPYLGEVGS